MTSPKFSDPSLLPPPPNQRIRGAPRSLGGTPKNIPNAAVIALASRQIFAKVESLNISVLFHSGVQLECQNLNTKEQRQTDEYAHVILS